ncbi:hypothetical protein [Mycolicibacterium brumae]
MVLLAEEDVQNRGPDFGKASPIALLILVLLLIAVLLLGRSMGKQLRKVPENFDDVPAADPKLRKRARKLHHEREVDELRDVEATVEAKFERAVEEAAGEKPAGDAKPGV